MFLIVLWHIALCLNLEHQLYNNMACLTPFHKKNDDTLFPCGKCIECTKRRASAWSFRLMEQDKISVSAHFITLTYDIKHVPLTEKGYMTLNQRHMQLFIKKLRKTHAESKQFPIRYYYVGEYGGKTNRPHYHIILFNAEVEKVQPAWQYGQVHYGTVGGASIGYTLKYITKARRIPEHKNDDRVREFSNMSKGIGVDYIKKNGKWIGIRQTSRIGCISQSRMVRRSLCQGITRTSCIRIKRGIKSEMRQSSVLLHRKMLRIITLLRMRDFIIAWKL